MRLRCEFGVLLSLTLLLATGGCQSSSRADRGALLGGAGGALVGGIVGKQLGNTGAGVAIGALGGALTGAVIGDEIDKSEANNRRMLQEQYGRQVRAGAVSNQDVVSMVQAGVDENVIITHIRAHGVKSPLQPNDLIYLQQSGVSNRITQAMQEPPRPRATMASAPAPRTVIIHETAPPPIIVTEHCYHRPMYYPRPRVIHHRPHKPAASVNFSFGH
ncbi:MAG: glycine zipper 2TM domain-containing protein [Planctomycetes bacterium]|nr:glycine zipper 2TM domain-containing protein [Planctomycetota bacterium]